jgi:hypothetical protein
MIVHSPSSLGVNKMHQLSTGAIQQMQDHRISVQSSYTTSLLQPPNHLPGHHPQQRCSLWNHTIARHRAFYVYRARCCRHLCFLTDRQHDLFRTVFASSRLLRQKFKRVVTQARPESVTRAAPHVWKDMSLIVTEVPLRLLFANDIDHSHQPLRFLASTIGKVDATKTRP